MIQPQSTKSLKGKNENPERQENLNKNKQDSSHISSSSPAKSLYKYWKSNSYSKLLNKQELKKAARRDLWQLQVKQMLGGFMKNMHELNQALKFKMSGKVLNSSTYLLKSKTHSIINSSEETQEEIDEAQQPEEPPFMQLEGQGLCPADAQMMYGEEMIGEDCNLPLDEEICNEEEIFEAFEELKQDNLLNEEQIEAFQKAKVEHLLNLDSHKLTEKIEKWKKLIEPPLNFIYKKVQFQDLVNALNEVLNKPKKKKKKKKKKQIDKSKIPFLPDNFISKAEEKRQNFESRIDEFYDHLEMRFTNEPLGFLQLVKETNQEINAKAIVNTLLIVLHLINHKRIELWKSYIKENDQLKERTSENDGSNIYLSPKREKRKNKK